MWCLCTGPTICHYHPRCCVTIPLINIVEPEWLDLDMGALVFVFVLLINQFIFLQPEKRFIIRNMQFVVWVLLRMAGWFVSSQFVHYRYGRGLKLLEDTVRCRCTEPTTVVSESKWLLASQAIRWRGSSGCHLVPTPLVLICRLLFLVGMLNPTHMILGFLSSSLSYRT